jgi:sec-independent protein translocase protein TatA
VLGEIFGIDGVIVLVVVVVVLFGGSQIPKLARSLGSARKEFKTGLEGEETAAAVGTSSAVPTPTHSTSGQTS